jgi:hypothetical protein
LTTELSHSAHCEMQSCLPLHALSVMDEVF